MLSRFGVNIFQSILESVEQETNRLRDLLIFLEHIIQYVAHFLYELVSVTPLQSRYHYYESRLLKVSNSFRNPKGIS